MLETLAEEHMYKKYFKYAIEVPFEALRLTRPEECHVFSTNHENRTMLIYFYGSDRKEIKK